MSNGSESRIAIEGLPEGTEIALVNPDLVVTRPGASGGAASAVGGPR